MTLRDDFYSAALDESIEYPTCPPLLKLMDRGYFRKGTKKYRIARTFDRSALQMAGRLIIKENLTSGIEIGTLFGFSTLHLAEALARTGGTLDTIDKRQEQNRWGDAGLISNIHEVAERLTSEGGYDDVVRFVVGESNAALPRLIRQGRRYDVALIDGAHNFPMMSLDFIAVDVMLVVGGYVFLDDVNHAHAVQDGNFGGPNRMLNLVFASGRYEVLPLTADTAVCRKLADGGST